MTQLIGVVDDSTYTGSGTNYSAGRCFREDYTCATSGTVTRLEVKISAWNTASNVKLILCNSSGSHLVTGTINSSAGTGWVGVDVSGPAVTASTVYRLAAICDAGFIHFAHNGAAWSADYDASGTYASPPNPVAGTGSENKGSPGFRVQGTTVTPPTLTDVDGDETVTSTQTGVVFTGTAFGASQGSSTLQLTAATEGASVLIDLSPTAWSDTSITADIIRTQGGYSLPYGAVYALLTTDNGDSFPEITHLPPDARSWVTLTSLATEGKRITAVGTAIGDQLEVTSVTGGGIGDVTLNADGTYDCAIGVTSFTVRGWDYTDGTLGTEGTQTVTDPDATSPAFTDGPEITATGITTATVGYTSNETGTGAVVVTASGAAQPSDSSFDAAAEAITAATPVSKNLTGLTAGSLLKCWVQIKDAAGNRTTSSAMLLTSNTGATSRIVLTSYAASALNRITAVTGLAAGDIVEVGTITGTGAVDVTVDGTAMCDAGVTAFQVYRGNLTTGWDAVQSQSVPAKNAATGPRTVKFLASPDLSTWTQTITGGGTIVLSGTGNKRATITNDGTRTFLSKNAAVTAGRWYALTADIVSAAANFDTDSYGDAHFLIYDGVQAGDQFYPITSASNGTRRGIVFQALTTGTETFRVGVGAAGNREAGGLVIENLQIVDYGTTQPALIDKFYDVSGSTYPLTIYTSMEAASTYAAGVVTPITPTVQRSILPQSLMLCIGDSYGLNDRYPLQIQRAHNAAGSVCEYYNHHIGGQTLAQIRDRLAAALNGSDYPAGVAPLWTVPKTLILEGGGNSILDNMSASAVLAQLDECITIAEAAGVEKIVLVNLPPFKNYASYTEARETQALAYNALLGSQYSGYRVYDLYSAVAGDVNTDALSKRANGDTWDYDSGDGLHPTTAASVKIGSGISSLQLLSAAIANNSLSIVKPLARPVSRMISHFIGG